MFEKISLNSLKFFYFVAKHGSVTQAANTLFVTQSAVSKQIYNLEESIHTPLFERRNKALYLTAKGEKLFQCCQKMFKELDDCLISLQENSAEKKHLVLSCEPTLSIKWLIPRLNKFKALKHSFDIVLLTGGGKINFKQEQIDLAIRRNDFYWGEHIFSEKIADEYMCLAQNKQSSQNKNILISTSRPNFIAHLEQLKPIQPFINNHQLTTFEHFYLCLEACLSDLGSTIISMYMIEKELEHQFLTMPISPFKDGSAYYLLTSQPFLEDSRKLIFLEWLKEEMQASQSHFHLMNS